MMTEAEEKLFKEMYGISLDQITDLINALGPVTRYLTKSLVTGTPSK
jgi:hypothetical protein